jgi:Bacterial extracellular solute-binding protein
MTVPEPRSGAQRSRKARLGRRFAAIAGASGLAVAMAVGAGANSANAKIEHAALSGNLSITFSTFDFTTLDTGLLAWEKLNPGVHVTVADVSNNPATYVPALQTEQAAGNQPDINEAYDALTPTLEVDGLAGDMKSVLTSSGIYPVNYWYKPFIGSYIPVSSTGGVTVGNPYGVPLEADATVILYNENEFKAAHLAFPKDGWTWTQFLADAKKLRKGSGATQTQYGVCLRSDWQALYNHVLQAYGVTAFTQTRANFDSPAAVKAWKLMLTPFENGDAVPESQIGANAAGDCGPVFESGEAAMGMAVRGGAAGYAATIGNKFKWNVVTMPTITVGNHKPVIPSGGGSVSFTMSPSVLTGSAGGNHTADLPNAESFMKYLFSAAGQKVLEDTFGVVPSVPSLNGPNAEWRHLAGGPGPNESFPQNNNAWSIDAAAALIAPSPPGTVFTLSNTAVPNMVQAVTTGAVSLSSALSTLQSQLTAAYAAQG